MNIKVNLTFLKELAKLPAKERRKVEKLLFEEVENFTTLSQIPNFYGKIDSGKTTCNRVGIGKR